MDQNARQIQRALNKRLHLSLAIDGILGPASEKALIEFRKDKGLPATPVIDDRTIELLFNGGLGFFGMEPEKKAPLKFPLNIFHALGFYNDPRPDTFVAQPPWIKEISKYMFAHEVTENKTLKRWLKSDGRTLGDPSVLPWCGDAVETAMKLTMPNEIFPKVLKENPYWAQNWAQFGLISPLRYGAVVVFTRPRGGHVGFAVGYDPENQLILVRGGNQSNMVSDTWISEKRLLGYGAETQNLNVREVCIPGVRRPHSYSRTLNEIPIINAKSTDHVSIDEA